MPMEASLKIDHSDIDEALAKVRELKSELRSATRGGGGGEGGGGSNPIRAANAAANAEARRERSEAIAYERAHNDIIRQRQAVLRRITSESSGGKNPVAENSKGFREWDNSLRKVEHTGRGLLGLFGVSGGLLGIAHLVGAELQDWYATLDKINKQGVDTGKSIAGYAARMAPGMLESQLKGRRPEWEALGWTPEEAAKVISDPSTLAEKKMMRRKELAEMAAGGREEQAARAAVMGESKAAFSRRYNPTAYAGRNQQIADQYASEERARGRALEDVGIGSGERTGYFAGGWKRFWHEYTLSGDDFMGGKWDQKYKEAMERRMAEESGAPRPVVIVGDSRGLDGSESN